MDYYEYLFPYEVFVRIFNDNGNSSAASTFSVLAESFVSFSTYGTGYPKCPPPKIPPCRWPIPDAAQIFNPSDIENLDLVLPLNDGRTYAFNILDDNDRPVVIYSKVEDMHRFFRYPRGVELSDGEYKFQAVINNKETIFYPFSIQRTTMKGN